MQKKFKAFKVEISNHVYRLGRHGRQEKSENGPSMIPDGASWKVARSKKIKATDYRSILKKKKKMSIFQTGMKGKIHRREGV